MLPPGTLYQVSDYHRGEGVAVGFLGTYVVWNFK